MGTAIGVADTPCGASPMRRDVSRHVSTCAYGGHMPTMGTAMPAAYAVRRVAYAPLAHTANGRVVREHIKMI